MNSIERGTRWSVFEAGDRNTWHKLTRQVQDFLAAAGRRGPVRPARRRRRLLRGLRRARESPQDVAAGRVSFLVGLRATRAGEYSSFLVTHSPEGSRVRPARSNLLPAGTRMTVTGLRGASRRARRRPGRARSRRNCSATTASRGPRLAAPRQPLPPETAAAGRRDNDAVARFYRDFSGGGQRF